MTTKKTTADEQKLVFETPHTSRRDETRLTPTSKNRPVSSRRLVCGGHKRYDMYVLDRSHTRLKHNFDDESLWYV